MTQNFLKLNQDKTEILVIGGWKQVENLGVITDSECHIRNMTKVSFYHLRNIARVRPFLFQIDTEKLTHAFISSRLDYCNALLSGVSKRPIGQLQLAQNAAACAAVPEWVLKWEDIQL